MLLFCAPQAQPAPPPVAVVVCFLIGFPVFWCVILKMLALLGGWAELASAYPNSEGHVGRQYWFQSARFRMWVSYNSALVLSGSIHGLALSTLLPFRPGHPPILLPWSEVRATLKKGIFGDWVALEPSRRSEIRVLLWAKAYQKIRKEVGDAVPEPVESLL